MSPDSADAWASRVACWLLALDRIDGSLEFRWVIAWVRADQLGRTRPAARKGWSPETVTRLLREVRTAERILRDHDERVDEWREESRRGGEIVVSFEWEGKAPPAPVVPIEAATGRGNPRKRARARLLRRGGVPGPEAA